MRAQAAPELIAFVTVSPLLKIGQADFDNHLPNLKPESVGQKLFRRNAGHCFKRFVPADQRCG